MTKVQNEGYEVLRVLCGSRAYGLNTDDSDFDYHAVYVVPTSRLLKLGPPIKASASVADNEDNTAWELAHFLQLALKGNPTVLETFIAPSIPIPQELPPVHINNNYLSLGEEIRGLFPYVLSRKAVYDSFRGYATSQVHKATIRETNERRRIKAVIAYLRTMIHGCELLANGTYETMLPDAWRDKLLRMKKAESFKEIEPFFLEYQSKLENLMKVCWENTVLNAEPDLDVVNDFLLTVRKNVW